jgi:hypothetical protein
LGYGEVLLAKSNSRSNAWSMPAKPYKNSSPVQTSVEELALEIHRIHPELLERQVRVLVVGSYVKLLKYGDRPRFLFAKPRDVVSLPGFPPRGDIH